MTVKVKSCFVLIGSYGGAPKNPVWVYNLRANPEVVIRDRTEIFKMWVREVLEVNDHNCLWNAAVDAYAPYKDYQEKTCRKIPVFLAEPAWRAINIQVKRG